MTVLRQAEAGRDLDDLLVAALHRAIALVQVNHVAVLVAEDLHLDVLGARNVFFEEHGRIAEGAFGFRLRLVEQAGQVAGLVHDAHAASAAAEGGLDDQRETDCLRDLQRLVAVGNGFFGAGQDGHVDFLRERAGGGLVAHHVEQLRSRPDEGDAGLGAGAGEFGILGEKSVAGMDGVDARFLGHRDDALDVEIRGDRALALADEIGLVRLEAMDAEAVLLGVNGDGAQAQFGAGAENADGDFAAVGRHQFLELTTTGGWLGDNGAMRHRATARVLRGAAVLGKGKRERGRRPEKAPKSCWRPPGNLRENRSFLNGQARMAQTPPWTARDD